MKRVDAQNIRNKSPFFAMFNLVSVSLNSSTRSTLLAENRQQCCMRLL